MAAGIVWGLYANRPGLQIVFAVCMFLLVFGPGFWAIWQAFRGSDDPSAWYGDDDHPFDE